MPQVWNQFGMVVRSTWRHLVLLALFVFHGSVADTVHSTLNDGEQGTCSLEDAACKQLSLPLDLIVGVGCKPKKLDYVSKAKNSNTAENCGEDAYYVVGDSSLLRYASVGVADGVGGWQENGVDPSAFSFALVDGAKESFSRVTASKEQPHPRNMMEDAFVHVKAGGDKNPGGSTAVFLVLDKLSKSLETANLGDSGYIVIRNGAKHFRSVEQTWAFNAPYQLSLYPSWMRNGGDHYLPKDAFTTKHTMQHGDIVIVGSDGLFDNVFDEEILTETDKFLGHVLKAHPDFANHLKSSNVNALQPEVVSALKKAMMDLSYSLTLMANTFAHDKSRESPFSKLAKEGYGYQFQGGKVDDTTVLAVYIHAKAHD
ncbi:hypothetical protein H310_05852 [Aphanomyces invadans]|nr:hypothetical protein H310_05852 [Aphanomyces invadans]ETW02305.1 hypothetical protein H310_05852 [Aphanomyces invadans]|eukprot:XP_008868910.1 hypothetical protein H310_05852 [Aphanomyces invadans]